MGSLATFKTAYLNTTVLTTGDREQVAGPVHNIDRLVGEGHTVAAARNLTLGRAARPVHRAQRRSTPFQGSLAADFYGLDAA